MNQRTSELTVDNQRAHTAEVENTDEHRFTKRRGRPSPATKDLTAETQVVRKNRSAGVSPASEPRQLLLGQHDLCQLEAGDTFFLTTTEFTEMRGEYLLGATWQGFLLLGAQVSRSPRRREDAKKSFAILRVFACLRGEIVWLRRGCSVTLSDLRVSVVRNCLDEI